MPVTNFPEYAQEIENVLNAAITANQAVLLNVLIDQRSAVRGYISGSLQFHDGSELHFREFVDLSLPEPSLMYAYHFQDVEEALIFRYAHCFLRLSISTLHRVFGSSQRPHWPRLWMKS